MEHILPLCVRNAIKMLDLTFIKENKDKVLESIQTRKLVKIADSHEFDKNGIRTKTGKTYWSDVYPTLQW